MRQRTLTLMVLLLLGVIYARDVAAAQEAPSKTPLIAELLATPEAFSGRTVTIYGLVIGVSDDGGAFMLQDVSQKPLRILRGKGKSVTVGDQVLLQGIFRSEGGQHYVSAELIEPTKVSGGG